jgi:hypothetical protein
MKKVKKALAVFAVALAAASVYALFWGPLFPWNPWKPGYRAIRSEKAVIFTRRPERLTPAYKEIDSYMAEAEKTFDLKYHEPVKVIVGYSELRRRLFLPWSKAKAVSLPTGDVVYICANRIDNDKGNHDEYLRHELTHALLQQNAGLWRAWIMLKDQWLQEGVPVYFAGPRYMTRDEMIEKFRAAGLTPSTEPHQLFADAESRRPDFNYTMWGDFVGRMIDAKGLAVFNAFLRDYLDDPDQLPSIFAVHYGKPFDQAAGEYEAAMMKDIDRSNPMP